MRSTAIPFSITRNRRLFPLFGTIAIVGCFAVSISVADERQDLQLADGWKFTQDDATITTPADHWEAVTIPHTWNTKGAPIPTKASTTKKPGYYRGAGWYSRSLDIPAGWQGKRVFIRFEAVSLVSSVYINGQAIGEHRGGFTAFCYELTPYLHFGGANELRVEADNRHQDDVPPLSGDFNIDGGIYRPVNLLVTDAVCISPLKMASPGVFLTTKSLSATAAQIEFKTLVSNGATAAADVQVRIEIRDAGGKIVGSETQPANIPAGQTAAVLGDITLATPHLWNGRKDPYLYTAAVSIQRGTDTLDTVSQPLGLRTVEISEERGFLLNGQPYPVYGVNRHQDFGDQGWAASFENQNLDAQLILDLGATAIRLAHYPQSDYWHDLCDRNGLLLWNEVSLVNDVRKTEAFNANAEQQLRELILQRYNHPCIAFWGLFNELSGHNDPVPLLKHLKSVVVELDRSRLIVAASALSNKPFNQIPDALCINRYPGWYGTFGHMPAEIDSSYKEFGKRIGISEYGAGANTLQHEDSPLKQPKTSGPFHPEEWQAYVHENDWAAMKGNQKLWGTFIWSMFDFAVSTRNEGSQPHLNDKGLVTQDRKTKKDVYFFYQANWSDKPMVHIVAGRMTPRQQATTEVKVYSNCDKVELFVNGTSQGAAGPNNIRIFRWTGIRLKLGNNEIKAVTTSAQEEIIDTCQWTLTDTPPATVPSVQ
jgi:beta-galactosidase